MFTFVEPVVFVNVTAAPADVIGDEKIVPESVSASDEFAAIAEAVRSTVDATPTVVDVEATAADPAVKLSDETTVACDATAVTPPNDTAAATTSATRLNVVFVDIVFLSRTVEIRNFPISA